VPSGTIQDATPGFAFTAQDSNYNLKSVKLLIDGKDAGAFGGSGTTYTFTAPKLAAGSHTWQFTVVSLSGKSTVLSGSFAVAGAGSASPGSSTGSVARRIVAPVSVRAQRGKVARIQVRVVHGSSAVAGARVTCKIAGRVVSRARTNARGIAVCTMRASRSARVTVVTSSARAKVVRLVVR
jgi:hypothetical protein